DFQKKQPDEDSAPSTSSSQSDLFPSEINSDNGNTSIPTQSSSPSQPLSTDLNVASPSEEECGPCTDTAHVSLTTPTKRSCDTGDRLLRSAAAPLIRYNWRRHVYGPFPKHGVPSKENSGVTR
ncbi:hypothetical protein GDO78_019441, partial [Eleutherodactylus coqui]